MSESNQLQPNRQRAIDLLLAGQSCREVAEELSVNRSTVWRWTQDPDIAEELQTLRSDRRKAIRESVDSAALEAVEVLRDLMRDQSIPPAVRARAACSLLDRVDLDESYEEVQELRIISEARIDDLSEAQVAALEACPDGLTGLRLRFPEEALPPPILDVVG